MSRCMRALLWHRLLLLLLLPLLLTSSLISSVHSRSLDAPDQVWRDWLLVEDMAPSDVGSAPGSLVRRITPKSVFVAPNFNPSCKEGQQVDAQGKCVQIVRVDQAAHLNFMLKRFNSMFAAPPPPSKKVEKDSLGPFHISLPLGGVERPEFFGPQSGTTTQPITTTPPPRLTTTTFKPLTTMQKTETTTVTMPSTTSFSSTIDNALPPPSKKVEKDTLGSFHISLPLGGVGPEIFGPQSGTTTQPITTTPLPQLSTTSFKPSITSTIQNTETTTITMPPTTSFSPTINNDAATELLNFSDESTTSRIVHETLEPSTFFTQPSNPTFISSPTPTQDEEIWSSHRIHVLPTTQTDVTGSQIPSTLPTTQTDVFESHRPQSSPTTFNTQNPDFLFEGVHRTRPSLLQTSTASVQDFDKTVPFSSHTTLIPSPTLQTIQPFEGIHRARPSSLHTTFAPPTVKTNGMFSLKGFQRTTLSSSHQSPPASNLNTRLWGNEGDNYYGNGNNQNYHSSYFWPQPASMWNPFPSMRSWPVMDRTQNVYRRHYYQPPVDE